MLIVRYRRAGEIRHGILEGDQILALEGDLFGTPSRGPRVCALAEAALLAPVTPSKVVAVGLNYADHAKESGQPVPDEPIVFLKPATSVIGPGQAIVYPEMTKSVDHEAELAVVIGRTAYHVSPTDALRYVLGYTCGNDVSARDLQRKDGQWTRAKGFDTFCPLGPAIATTLDPRNLAVAARVNGELKQSSNTRQLIFSVADLVSFISRVMTLLPGDVIMTGTPAGVSPIKPGDTVEIEVEGVGVLRNPVLAP